MKKLILCKIVSHGSVLLLFFFFQFVHSDDANANDDKILQSFRPLKYSQSCKDFCENVVCQSIKECEDGIILQNETYCGCCEACVKFLDIGDSCRDLITGSLALGSQKKCKKGTTCESGICQLNKEEKSCFLLRDIRENHIEENIKTKKYESEISVPQCDNEGYYSAKQKKNTRSICVDKSGKRIFGSADDLLENTCVCSRMVEEKIKEDPISFYVTPQERCSSSGSFDKLQCIGTLCYCADVNIGSVKSELVRKDFLQNLECYDPKVHTENYLKECEKELQRTRKLAYEFRKKGVTIHGIDRVKCDPDGTFSPTQCLPDRCVCTDKKGQGISQYAAELKNVFGIRMTCYCARDDNSEQFQTFTCESYGSYKPFTCFVDKCICVDEDGESISSKDTEKLKELKNLENDADESCKEIIEELSEYPTNEDDYDEYDD